ncbi:MAG: hypothetical protein U9Q62_08555 [Campylobacterota bacterium]|nr:hypothetical protein [Campylobacterota bacterium]
MRKSLLLSVSTALLLFSGCSSREPEPVPVELEKSEDEMTVEEATKIIAERNKEIVIDISKLTKVVAIITKQLEDLRAKTVEAKALEEAIRDSEGRIGSLEKRIAELEKVKKMYLAQKAVIDERLKAAEANVADYQNDKRIAEAVKKTSGEFEKRSGYIRINSYQVNLRVAPLVGKKTKQEYAERGDVFAFKAVSSKWYLLENDLYVHATVVCEDCLVDVNKVDEGLSLESPEVNSEEKLVKETAVAEEKTETTEAPTVPEDAKLDISLPILTAEQISEAMRAKGREKSSEDILQ